jgi:glycosyltransferase involved in cell wall biosynthesis
LPAGDFVNIGLMIYGELDQLSGGYLYDRKMVEILRRKGARVEIISLPGGNYALQLTENIFGALPRVLQKFCPDVLIQDELCHPSLFHSNRTLKKNLNCPVISIVHHLLSSEVRPAWQNTLYRRVEKSYLATVDGFIFNSETTRGVIVNLLGTDRPCVVVPPGGDHLTPDIDDTRIVERCGWPGPLKILFIGNVIPRKGLHELIIALSSLPRRTWRLTVAGNFADDAGYAGRIRKLIAHAGLMEQVALLGTVSDEKLAALLKDHHCLAVPSFYEGFGIVYLEAMAFGLPVIATTSGAVPEVVADGREGFLVPPGNKAALADRVGLLIRDRNLLAAMSLAARKRYGRHPSWADGAGRVWGFLKDMIG